MAMNTRFKSRGPIIVAEPFEVVAGNDVEVFDVVVVDFVVVSCSNVTLFMHTPLTFISPGSHLDGTTSKIDCCVSSSFPTTNNCINFEVVS